MFQLSDEDDVYYDADDPKAEEVIAKRRAERGFVVDDCTSLALALDIPSGVARVGLIACCICDVHDMICAAGRGGLGYAEDADDDSWIEKDVDDYQGSEDESRGHGSCDVLTELSLDCGYHMLTLNVYVLRQPRA